MSARTRCERRLGLATLLAAGALLAIPTGAAGDGAVVVVGARVGQETGVLLRDDGTVLRPAASVPVRVTRERRGDTVVVTIV